MYVHFESIITTWPIVVPFAMLTGDVCDDWMRLDGLRGYDEVSKRTCNAELGTINIHRASF